MFSNSRLELVASLWECQQYSDQGSQVLTTLPDFPYRLNISTTLNFCFLHVCIVCVIVRVDIYFMIYNDEETKQHWFYPPPGSRDVSAVKNTYCTCRGPWFDSQPSDGGSQPPITPVLGDLMSSSGVQRHQACTWCTYIHASKILIYLK